MFGLCMILTSAGYGRTAPMQPAGEVADGIVRGKVRPTQAASFSSIKSTAREDLGPALLP